MTQETSIPLSLTESLEPSAEEPFISPVHLLQKGPDTHPRRQGSAVKGAQYSPIKPSPLFPSGLVINPRFFP
jgi:hypothetical protein